MDWYLSWAALSSVTTMGSIPRSYSAPGLLQYPKPLAATVTDQIGPAQQALGCYNYPPLGLDVPVEY